MNVVSNIVVGILAVGGAICLLSFLNLGSTEAMLTKVLRINAVCEGLMGLGFLLQPDTIIPELNHAGRVTTRVFGTSLLALSAVSVACSGTNHPDARAVAASNLIFHVVGGVVLGVDAATPLDSPFAPPAALHLGLTGAIVVALGRSRG